MLPDFVEWVKHNFPTARPYQPLLGIMEEVGELCHEHLKAEQDIRNPSPDKARDAIGDIYIFLNHYCYLMGWSLDKIIVETWAEVKKRDWKKFPKDGINE